ncbi:hypothetical protein [Dyella tabacisoli]|uniref:Polymer-forming cytoskeletal protein n=1 Tax=Dyella tabacisoli TaxID=2282381 RepID=A0A369UPJ2_9GAMM|nr:hypothetical protein [Dyella tabacisoli]RDD82253.1 hypothetical protein DVJ77_07460 [Dyella tabacisoli]
MRRTLLVLALIPVLALSLTAAAHSDNDIDKVNGAVRVEAGQQAGDVSTVNGGVHIADGAGVQKASTVNGSVELGDKVQAREIGTVNGAITIGSSSHVSGTVEAVNGSIRLGKNADVTGKTSNVNGIISLDGAHIGGGIETVSGDIMVGANSRVEGGILVDKPGGWFNSNSRKPHVVIGPHAVVQGPLEFRRDVVLDVSSTAQIGPVKGATPVPFSGDQP